MRRIVSRTRTLDAAGATSHRHRLSQSREEALASFKEMLEPLAGADADKRPVVPSQEARGVGGSVGSGESGAGEHLQGSYGVGTAGPASPDHREDVDR